MSEDRQLLKDGENVLSDFGAATAIGRNKNVVQIAIACGSEAEAEAIIARILNDVRMRGVTTIVLGGTVDEPASAGMVS